MKLSALKRIGILTLVTVISLTMLTAGCSGVGGKKVVKIGVIYPLSGDMAPSGADQKNAMLLAQDVINGEYDLNIPLAKTKGLPNLKNAQIQLVFGDSQGKPEVARSEAERLIKEEKVVALMGAYASSSTAPASQVAERYGIPFVTAESTRADLTDRGFKWFWRNIPYDSLAVENQFKFLDDQVKAGKQFTNIGLLYENSLYGQGAATEQKKYLAERGWKVAADVAYPKEITDVTSEVLKLKAAKVDVLLMTSYLNDGVLFQKAFKEQNFNPQAIVGLEGGFVDKQYIPNLGKTADYLITSATWSSAILTTKPIAGKVNDLFKQKFGKDMSAYQPHAFTGVMVLADAINRAGSTKPEDIQKAIIATDYPGESLVMPWSGVKYNDKGQNIYGDVMFLQILDGQYQIVYPTDIAGKPVVWPAPKWSDRK
ncbi:MAG: ABC transporter substrate-binding protein [Bacillota bacterium]